MHSEEFGDYIDYCISEDASECIMFRSEYYV
jgi:hypothetical protein